MVEVASCQADGRHTQPEGHRPNAVETGAAVPAQGDQGGDRTAVGSLAVSVSESEQLSPSSQPVLRLPPLSAPGQRFPCHDAGNRYTGCIGMAECAAQGTTRCWDGRLVLPGGLVSDREVPISKAIYHAGAKCATCAHAVDVPGAERPMLRDGGYKDDRLVTCELGCWSGLCSVYALHHHRMPLRPQVEAGCDHYAALLEDRLRPELVRQREADRLRAKTQRQALRESRAKKERQAWGEVL